MYQKFFNSRRFQRNNKLLSPPGHNIGVSMSPTPREFGSPIISDRGDGTEQLDLSMSRDQGYEYGQQAVVERLLMIEEALETERT